MEVSGTFDDFADAFPESLIPWVFRVILQEWPKFPRTLRQPLENRITKPFVGHLQKCQDIRRLPFFFDPNPKLVEPDNDTEYGEVDIRVMHGKRPKVFFAFECKCLNVVRRGRRDSQAGKYVGADGMGCFLSRKYWGGSDCGGMIGYVMDNNLYSAKDSINKALKRNVKQLGLQKPEQLNPTPMCPEDSRCSETRHHVNKTFYTIYHILLEYNGDRLGAGAA
jgi:hypothetical protein